MRCLPLLLLLLTLPAFAADLRVAVLDFTDASGQGDMAALGKGLQSMLTTDLSQVSTIAVVERARLLDLQGEITLGKDGWADPATAARLGKLAGATHLLAGSYTVSGTKMRIDARLVAVEEGRVVLAESQAGERDAFFELEKNLVTKLIRSLGAEPQARERASLAKIHTADWPAFLDFSAGIDRFDRKDWDGALERLRAATEKDPEFTLARYTLSRYQELITTLRARSDEIETARHEMERLKKLEGASAEATVVRRLMEIAARVGDKDRRERLTALYLLTVGYGNLGGQGQKLWELRQTEDTFAMARAAEGFARGWYAEAKGLWPQVPPLVTGRFARSLPDAGAFDEDFRDAVADLWGRPDDLPENRTQALLDDLRYPAEFARLLLLDGVETLALREELTKMAEPLHPTDFHREENDENLVKEYRNLLRLDDSTRILERQARSSTNEWAIRGLTEQIAQNRDLARLVQRGGKAGWQREFLLLAGEGGWSLDAARNFLDDHPDLDNKGRGYLARFREVDDGAYIRLGDLAVHVLQGEWWMLTGPRDDPKRAASLRYDKPSPDKELDSIVLIDGVPRAGRRVHVVADWTPPADYWPKDGKEDAGGKVPLPEGTPTLSLWWGVRDVRVPKQDGPDGGPDLLLRPMRGARLELAKDGARIGTFVETERGAYDRTARVEGPGRTVSGKAGGAVEIDLDTCGARPILRLGGKAVSGEISAAGAGYAGLHFAGAGFVEVRELRVSGCGDGARP